MKLIPKKVIYMTLFLFLCALIFSCAKDTDLLLSSVLNDPEISLEEAAMNEELVDGDLVTRTFTFSPTNDAYIQNNLGYNKSIIRLEEDTRTSYLMFDLSQVNGTITDAVLQFSIDSDEGDGTIAVHKGSATDWTEENLNSTNVPNTEAQLGITNKAYKIGSPEKVILDPNNLSAEITTLVLTHNSGNDLAFASKEHPANKGPKLIIVYSALAESPLIEQQPDNAEEENTTQEEAVTPPTATTEETTPQNNPTPSEEPSTTSAATEGAYYVTTSGNANNNGLSEATAWSIDHAFERAVAGDVVYIKAGNYGNKQLSTDNSGNVNNPIKFIGYTNKPGDLVSSQGSTFTYGESLNSNKMPLLSSNEGIAITIFEPYIFLENIQITGYTKGIMAHSFATNFNATNLIITELGNQNQDEYDGWGMDIRGENSLVKNSFVLNATAEAIKLSGASNSILRHNSVYADNPINPTDYYFFLAGGTNNAIVENCHAQRQKGLWHGGHGFNIKNDGAYNTFKNCVAVRTNFELTYEGVHNNTIDGGAIYGINTSAGEWHAVMSIIGGAHDNLIKNLHIQDTWTAITLAAYDDRKGADASLGHNNTFENVSVKNTNRILNIGGGTNYNAKAKNYTFKNSTFTDFDALAIVYYAGENFKFENCSFTNGKTLVTRAEGVYRQYNNFEVSWSNNTWSNIDFDSPN